MANPLTRHSSDALFRMSPSELNLVQEGVLITNAEGIILAVNEALMVIFGFTRLELLGRTCRFFHGPATDTQVLNEMRLAKKSGTTFSGKVLNYRKDCSAFWSELAIFPWSNDQQVVTHYVGVVKDISAHQAALAPAFARHGPDGRHAQHTPSL